MEELYLVKPTMAYADQITAYRAEFLERGDSLDGTSNLFYYSDPADWLAWLDTLADPAKRPDGFVPSTTLLCIRRSDERLVGMIDVRHELNEHLREFGGHIGYSVRPDERKKGYAKAMLRMALQEAVRLKIDRVLVTCNKDNEASRRTILANGGVLENEAWDGEDMTFVQRYWIEL